MGIGLFESDPEVIANAADRQMAHVRNFQTGEHSALSQRLLNELAAARVCLLDPVKKAKYDEALRAALAPPSPAGPEAPRLPAAILPSPPPPPVLPRAEEPAPAPEAAPADVPLIRPAPELLRARAARRRTRRPACPKWLTPVLAVIALVVLVLALVIVNYFGPGS